VVEHLAKVAGIHPFAAHRASIQVLGFVFGRIVLPARELNYRTVLFSHLVPPMREPECLTESGVGSVVIHIVSQQISVSVISDEVRSVVEEEWQELAHKLPPKAQH
jgi:hypothetical protein